MKSDNKSDYTIKNYDKLLTFLAKHTDLNDPEKVKQFVANQTTGNAYKRNIIIAYALYCKHYKIEWQKPKYRQDAKTIRIPTKEKLEKLISNAGMTLSIKLQISMETGLRPIELMNLKAKDIDLQQRIIYPTTAKYGASRQLRITQNLTERMSEYIARNKHKPEDKLFKGTPARYGDHYRKIRNRLAEKLKDPSLKTVRLYDFRHFFATNLYDKTKDILLVKQQMGHKKLDTTLIYTQLLNLNEDEWTCKAANTVEQATQLIENGFQYVTEMDGVRLFKKRK